jgi:hypothetical protein
MSERQAAVAPDGRLNYTSVSAVKKFTACAPAWYYRYKLRRPEPQGAGAIESSACHERTEHYLKTGEMVLGEIERRAHTRGLLPRPNDPRNPQEDDLVLEAEWHGLDADGVPFVAKIDCVDPRRVGSEGLLVINDWKFKKGIRKYGVGAELLRSLERPPGIAEDLWRWAVCASALADPTDEDGIQMVGYGEVLRRHLNGALTWARLHGGVVKTIRLRHVQVDKGDDAAEEVYIDVPVEKFEALWSVIAENLPKMKIVALLGDVTQVEPPPAAEKPCFKYGGCAFKSECPHFRSTKPADKKFRLSKLLLSPTKESQMGMLSKLQNKTVTPPAAVIPAEAPAPQKPTGAALAYVEAVQKGDEVAKAAAVAKIEAPVAAVLPPDAPAPVKTLEAAASEAAPTDAGPIGTESAPKKRGRKPAAEKAAETAPATPAAVEQGQPAGFILFVGCAPQKFPHKSLLPYVDALEAKVLSEFKEQLNIDIDDIRLSEGNEVGFGRWKAVLAKTAQAEPPTPGFYTVPALGMDDRIDVVVAALHAKASEVVIR